MTEIVTFREFDQSLQKLTRGDPKALKSISALLAQMALGRRPVDPEIAGRATEHGETRLKNCLKYRLSDGNRLVAGYEQGKWILVFCGNHVDTDDFLSGHVGKSILSNRNGEWFLGRPTGPRDRGQIVSIQRSGTQDSDSSPAGHASCARALTHKLSEKEKKKLFHRLKPHKDLEKLANTCTSPDFELTDTSDNDYLSMQYLLIDVLHSLSQEGEQAMNEARRLINGVQLVSIDDADGTEITRSSTDFDLLDTPSAIASWQERIERAANTDDWKEWMTRMHPAQQKYVDKDYEKPVFLRGVSGSGKTSVIVSRAESLAKKYPHEAILVVTLNRSLATLIQRLVTTKCPDLKNITVEAFFDTCRRVLAENGHNLRLFDDRTDTHRAHVDEIWTRYYQCEENNRDAEASLDIHDRLLCSVPSVDSQNYIREELDWARSAYTREERDNSYMKLERAGRKLALSVGERRAVLATLKGWEDKLAFVGVTDYLNLSTVLSTSSELEKTPPAYRCILVDEAQDFGTTELRILRRLVLPSSNDLFFCGDPAQKISFKSQDFNRACINIKAEELANINQNYRNTREILEFSSRVLDRGKKGKGLGIHALPPVAYNRSGKDPIVIRATDLSTEIALALAYFKLLGAEHKGRKYCVAICGYSEYELEPLSNQSDTPLLNGATTLDENDIFVSDLENTKGFEFDAIVVANCSDTCFPSRFASPEEVATDLARLYVAMTRAKSELIISYSGARPSDFIREMDVSTACSRALQQFMEVQQLSFEELVEMHAKEELSGKRNFSKEIEREIASINERGGMARKTWRDLLGDAGIQQGQHKPYELGSARDRRVKVGDMTWEQFLFSEYALGLNPSAVRKLRSHSKLHGSEKVTVTDDPIRVGTFRHQTGFDKDPKSFNDLSNKLQYIKSLERY